jgi:hypothetical protein
MAEMASKALCFIYYSQGAGGKHHFSVWLRLGMYEKSVTTNKITNQIIPPCKTQPKVKINEPGTQLTQGVIQRNQKTNTRGAKSDIHFVLVPCETY